jgi:hypothetical protein
VGRQVKVSAVKVAEAVEKFAVALKADGARAEVREHVRGKECEEIGDR